jgi:hypothetical protein
MDTDAVITFFDTHPVSRETVHDRLRGTIFGGALGDAIGLYTGSFEAFALCGNQVHADAKLEFLSKNLARQAYPEGKFQLVDPVTEFEADQHRCMKAFSTGVYACTD